MNPTRATIAHALLGGAIERGSETNAPPLPSEVRIFPAGAFEAKTGRYHFTDASARAVLGQFATHGVRKMFDYEHLSLKGDKPGDGISAGWFDVELRDGELWATNIKWTPKARKHLEDREYAYLSPTFDYDADTGEILYLENIALTNLPHTVGAKPLLMNGGADAPKTEEKGHAMNLVRAMLGMASTATEDEVVARLRADKEAADKAIKTAEEAAAKAAKLEQERDAERRESLITKLVADGKAAEGFVPFLRGLSDAQLADYAKHAVVVAKPGEDGDLPAPPPAPRGNVEQAALGGAEPTRQRPRTPSSKTVDVPPEEHLAIYGCTAEEYQKHAAALARGRH